ncbi:hypothetical protein [Parabacteroides sp. PF5-6]|uniref:hypothetical protein n=1 Tax=Parabacteroides sp. PF5-6 TaxID=1742403 RepID=UPI002405A8AD|nr:hypothetical protein [Parabacteroides sp. PF5-6]MDF9830165.1 hypothetical protein [Parabacteroides sp. PF5-6]
MKNSLLQYIILYALVACIALVIATLARIFTVSLGFDSFTAFIVFVVVLVVQAIVYLSIHVFLQNLMFPWIGNGLAKIPYFRNKIEQRQVSIIEEAPFIEEAATMEEEDTVEFVEYAAIEEENPEEEINELSRIPEQHSLEDIRSEQLQLRQKEQEEKLNVALNYTRKSFVLHLSESDLDILCHNVRIYIDKLDIAGLQPVKVKDLTAVDLRHFGWNIWNFDDKRRNQTDIAGLLKVVFPDIFRETEVKSIKTHLKDDELKGGIKIEDFAS